MFFLFPPRSFSLFYSFVLPPPPHPRRHSPFIPSQTSPRSLSPRPKKKKKKGKGKEEKETSVVRVQDEKQEVEFICVLRPFPQIVFSPFRWERGSER